MVTSLLIVFGAADAWFAFRANLESVSYRQQTEARVAAREIRLTLAVMEEQIGHVARLPWESGLLRLEDQQDEFHRLQRLIPSILELRALDAQRREQVFVSQLDADRLRSGIDLTQQTTFVKPDQGTVFYGRVYHRNQSEPFVQLAIRETPTMGRITVADIDLRHIARLAGTLQVGASGRAFLVDSENRIIAHPNLSKTLGRLDVGGHPQIRAIRAALGRDAGGPVSISTKNADGDEVRSTGMGIERPDWLLVVEEPLSEALLPVKAALVRTASLLALGLVVAFGVSLWLARRLTNPVLSLRDGAVHLGSGDLTARIVENSDDELGVVAAEFNRMAEKLQQSYAGLEAKVAERTTELAKANEQVKVQASELQSLNAELHERLVQLGQKRDEADRASAAKTRFLASASHDLRQPMHTIGLLVGILKERVVDVNSTTIVAKIESSIETMESLFKSLLDISKLDAGVVTPAISDIAVDDLFHRIAITYTPLANEKGLALIMHSSRAVVRSDTMLLERILGNLVGNAIAYTRQGRIVVGCRVRGAAAFLLVYDTGIGVAEAHLSDIFEEFYQVENPGRDRSKGLGLGLSIVKRSAALLGHQLLVRSRPGKGSVFGIEVPFATRTDRLSSARAGRGTDATKLPAGTFVAVIDDEDENRLALEELCRQWGCLVVGASSGAEAVATLATHLRAPDVIITDFRLKDGETGTEVISAIRRQAEQDVPAIVVTGDVSAADRSKFDFVDVMWLQKPLNPSELKRTAELALARISDRNRLG